MKEIAEILSQSTFCYAQPSGQGFTDQSNCPCYSKGEKCCTAYVEQKAFHELYAKLMVQGLSRKEILVEVRKQYNWNETAWIQHNVID